MKASNYILAAFAALVLISIFAFAIEAKGHKNTNPSAQAESMNEYPAGDFKALVVRSTNNQQIYLHALDPQKYKSNMLLAPANMIERLSNDTLFLSIPIDMNMPATLYCKGNISFVKLEKGFIEVHNLLSDSLRIECKNGDILFNSEADSFKMLDVDAKQSTISLNINKTKIDEIDIHLSGGSIFHLFQFGYSDKVSIDKDPVSKYRINSTQ